MSRYDSQPRNTKQILKWRETKNNGLIHQHQPEIDADRKNNLHKIWSDEKTGFGVTPETFASDQLDAFSYHGYRLPPTAGRRPPEPTSPKLTTKPSSHAEPATTISTKQGASTP